LPGFTGPIPSAALDKGIFSFYVKTLPLAAEKRSFAPSEAVSLISVYMLLGRMAIRLLREPIAL
jgi:hypothetical protein